MRAEWDRLPARREPDGRDRRAQDDRPGHRGDDRDDRAFLREASVLRQLEHPNIVQFAQMGNADGCLYFTMEFVAGVNADGLLKKRGGPLPVRLAVA